MGWDWGEPARHWQPLPPFAWTVIDNDRTLLRAAFDIQDRWQLSFRDSLIIAAAQRSGAPQLWTEDLTNGQRYDDVQAVNPFRS